MLEYKLKSKTEVFSVNNKLIGNSILIDYSDSILFITIPIFRGKIRKLKLNSKIKIIYYTSNKVYEFYSVVKNKDDDNIIIYEIDKPKELHIVQRRNCVRVQMILDMKYLVLRQSEMLSSDMISFEDVKKSYGERIQSCKVINLSGGMKIVIKERLEIDDRLIIISESSQINVVVLGKMIRRKKTRNREYSYMVGIQFIETSDKIKEKIIQFVFAKMRNQLKSYSRDMGK